MIAYIYINIYIYIFIYLLFFFLRGGGSLEFLDPKSETRQFI